MDNPVEVANQVSVFDDVREWKGQGIFRRKEFDVASLNTPCTVVKACIGAQAPSDEWEPCDITWLRGTEQLYLQNGIRYYGRL